MTHRRLPNGAMGLAAAVLVAADLGCASNRIDLSREGVVNVTVADCHPVTIAAKAEQDGDETVISGTIRRRSPMTPGHIHVDVTITTAAGQTLAAGTALTHPRYIPYRGNRPRPFAVRFPFVPPRGSMVHLVCDAERHPPGEFPVPAGSATRTN